MKIYDNIIFDTHNLFHRNHNVFKDLHHKVKGKVIRTGGIYGSIRSIEAMKKKFLRKGGKMYFATDNPTSKFKIRREILPEYKANRSEQSREFYRAVEYLILILMNYSKNSFVIQKQGVEADDFLPALIEDVGTDKRTLMISSDLDWARCIDYHGHEVDWYDGKDIVTKQDFANKYGFMPTDKTVINYKTYRGDDSDGIKAGLPNIGKKLLVKLIEYGDVFEVLADLEIIDWLSRDWKIKLRQCASHLRLNHQLVSFIDISVAEMRENMVECRFRPHTLRPIYRSLGFKDTFDKKVYAYFIDKENEKEGVSQMDFFSHKRARRI